jgi:hypothetical protein
MSVHALKDNAEMLKYLQHTAHMLRSNNHDRLANGLERAALFASGSASEFLHEAQIALEQVVAEEPTGIDTAMVCSVVRQIQEAFREIGGA